MVSIISKIVPFILTSTHSPHFFFALEAAGESQPPVIRKPLGPSFLSQRSTLSDREASVAGNGKDGLLVVLVVLYRPSEEEKPSVFLFL